MPKRARDEPWDSDNKKRRGGPLLKRRAVIPGSGTYYGTVARTRGPYSRGEMKYFDNSLDGANVEQNTSWTDTELDPSGNNALFTPQTGAAIHQRIGNKVFVKKITISGNFNYVAQADQTQADTMIYTRLVLVQDTQTNGVQMQGEDVFVPHQASAQLAIAAFQATKNFGRFKVLKDKTYRMPVINMTYDGTNMEQQGAAVPFKITHKFKTPVVVKFNNTNGGTVADIVDNSFHLLGICSADTQISNQLYYNVRVYFTE